jgi:hypothetical protein
MALRGPGSRFDRGVGLVGQPLAAWLVPGKEVKVRVSMNCDAERHDFDGSKEVLMVKKQVHSCSLFAT